MATLAQYQQMLDEYIKAHPIAQTVDYSNGITPDALASGSQTGAKYADDQSAIKAGNDFLATLTPEQRAEYQSLDSARYDKANKQHQMMAVAALGAMAAPGLLGMQGAGAGTEAAALPSFAGSPAGMSLGAGNLGADAASALYGAAPSTSLLDGATSAWLGGQDITTLGTLGGDLGGLGGAAGAGLDLGGLGTAGLGSAATQAAIAAAGLTPETLSTASPGVLQQLAAKTGLTTGQLLSLGGGLLGAVAGSTKGANSATTDVQSKIDPRIGNYIYGPDGTSGLMGAVNTLQQQQSAQGGLNDTQRQGLAMQKAAYMDPRYTAGLDQMRTQGASLMGAQQAANPFTTGQASLLTPGSSPPRAPFQIPNMPALQANPYQSYLDNLGFGRKA